MLQSWNCERDKAQKDWKIDLALKSHWFGFRSGSTVNLASGTLDALA
jgi:hypothetical protein